MSRVALLLVLSSAIACAPRVPRVTYSARFRIESAQKIPQARLEELSDRLEKAFEFVLAENRWTTPPRVRNVPLEVTLTSVSGDGAAASAHGPEAMTLTVGTLGLPKLDGVLAHELSHVQDLRVLGDRALEVPRYLHEGKALWLGHAYRMKTSEEADDATRARLLAALTAAEAKEALETFRGGLDQRRAADRKLVSRQMSVAVLFVEYLRTGLSPKPVADPIAHLARAFEAIGTGTSVPDAFRAQFGATLEQAEAGFVEFIAKTEGRPDARFAGTIYERYAAAQTAAPTP